MDILWHEYGARDGNVPIREAGLQARASVVGRLGMMMLACGTGAWRVRTSMNTLSELMHMSCSADIGLMSIQYSCFDGRDSFTQSLSLTNTGVNTSQLTRLEQFVRDFSEHELTKTCDEIHSDLDEIEKLGGLYSHLALGFASAFACGAFTFLLGGGLVEMFCAFWGAGIGHFIRCKLIKRHLTLFLNVMVSVSAACVSYTILFRLLEMFLHVRFQHEAGYICSMLFI
ncbi:MAG: threonine/serine exporter family protein, partial [Desulfovibrio sp.]|nr:threonine/serine exporter family protein [Desulfovibrio sp.]